MKVDLALVNKYSVPGPRYTSYPPATHFTDKITFDSLRELIRANNETERDLSLYFHLPFCYSLCWYCGCTTVITPQQGQSATYLGEIEQYILTLADGRPLRSLETNPEAVRRAGENLTLTVRPEDIILLMA